MWWVRCCVRAYLRCVAPDKAGPPCRRSEAAPAPSSPQPYMTNTRLSQRVITYALLGVAAVMLVGYAGHAQFDLGGHGLDNFFQKWVNDAIVLVCAVVCLLRAVSERRER